jgi:methyl-accepting chemotaxis protein
MEKGSNKVKFFSSMRFKILLMIFTASLFVTGVLIAILVPTVRKDIQGTNQDYLLDMATSYGKLLDITYDNAGDYMLENYEVLDNALNGVKISDFSTSYAYVVSADGTMLYHPTADKVGNPVENEMVKGLVSKLQSGQDLAGQEDSIQYLFKGKYKMASYHVGRDNKYILCITADKDEVMKSVNSITTQAIIAAVIVFIIVIIVSVTSTNLLIKPFTALTAVVDKIGALDLTKNEGMDKVKNRKDEMGVIARAISNLRHELVTIVGQISENSNKLTEANTSFVERFQEISENVSNVNIAVEEIAEGSTSQAQETTSAGEQVVNIGTVIEQNVHNVEMLENTVKEMNELSNKASATLKGLKAINEQTTDNIAIVSEQTNNTNASATKIQEAVTLIQDIASQTNLLSLNASIEAARAGEAGRGFAVVAEEIRKLADDSAASANEINNIVEELITNSNKSVGKMEEVAEDSKRQAEELQSTIDSFDSLRQCVEEVSGASADITTQMTDLEKQKNIISGVVEQLAAISEENAASTEETSASMQTLSGAVQSCQEETDTLNQLSVDLNDAVNKFVL